MKDNNKKYKIINNNQIGGKKSTPQIINFPFEYMYSPHAKLNVKWVIGDKSKKGENLPTSDFRDFYKLIKTIYFYKIGWGTDLHVTYLENEDEPCVLVAQLTNGVFVYIYSTSDYSGYDCVNDYFKVIYSHDLNNLYKFGLTDRVRRMLNVKQ